MSLHTLANHLQSAGRGEDKVLVHMTPGEVKGLQALAMSQGGSLTINPETGLPEAGILKSLLPMIAGFFLGPAGLGLTAMQSALTVGALGTAATGSLGKGFMMGLGAYGGAGLGSGLASAGAAAPNAAGNAAVGAVDDVAAAGIKSSGQTINSGAGLRAKLDAASYTPETVSGLDKAGGIQAYKPYMPSQGSTTLQGGLANSQVTTSPMARYASTNTFTPTNSALNESILKSPTFAPQTASVPTVTPPTNTFANIGGTNVNTMAADAGKLANPIEGPLGKTVYPEASRNVASNSFGRFDDVGRGFDKATSSWEGAKEVWNATPTGTGYGLAATGLSAIQAQQEEAAAEAKAKADAMAASRRGTMRPYEFSTELTENAFAPRESSSEFKYYVEPRFIPKETYKVAKEGGLMSLAVGGQVEEMSAANAMGANTGYPMANLQTPMYANPTMARPTPTNVISPSGDTGVNTYSGEMRMAFGGSATASANAPSSTAKYSYDPSTMKYTMTSAPSSGNDFERLYGKGVNPFLGTAVGVMSLMTKKPINELLNRPASNAPAVGSTSGGIAAPYMPPSGLAATNTSMVPNVQMQPQQNIDRQLGLEAFYPMMEQQLAMKGSNLQAQGYAEGGTANGGYSLGSYSDGGRLLRGPGDGVSDSIPASIGDRQPARLADGEFVVPARIVSEIGNGSTEAGARKLYAMMDRVQKARKKTVGKSKVAVNTRADKLLPA